MTFTQTNDSAEPTTGHDSPTAPEAAIAGAPRHEDEAERLASLHALDLVGTKPEPVFDWLAGLTANQLYAPVAMISLVDEHTLWFKAEIGLAASSARREGSICEWVVSGGEFFEVPDASGDLRFAASMGAAGLASYAGAPIFGVDGRPVGSLCVLDVRPRTLTSAERYRLEQLAQMVTGQLHLRLARAKATGAFQETVGRSELHRAMMTGALLPYYQPIVSLANGKTVGCEALARWVHPTQGVLSPAAFLEVAEREGLSVDLDFRILDRACRQVAQWRADPDLPHPPALSLNVSARHLSSRDLVDDIRAVLEGNALPGTALTIEVSEAILAGAEPSAASALNRLRTLGVSLTLDDFGTTPASATYLQKFPISGLKIHSDFVAGLGAGSRNQSMVESILRLATRLDLEVTAVGVETEAHAANLSRLGCPKAQGYLYAPALPATGLRQRLTA